MSDPFTVELEIICDGWMHDAFDELSDRIELSAKWLKTNGKALEMLDEKHRATIQAMIDRQLAIAVHDGAFAFAGLAPGTITMRAPGTGELYFLPPKKDRDA